MKSKSLVLDTILGLLLLFLMGSCSEEGVDVDNVNQQTLLVYMPWTGSSSDNGLYPIFLQNLDSIEQGILNADGLSNKRVLVFLSTSATQSELYEIHYASGNITHTTLKTYSGNDYTTASGISEILNDVKSNAEALNYALIIGSHGTGWTYKDDWTRYPYYAKKKRTRFFGSVSDLQNYATDISTLAEGIATSGMKMQYILFDDCYMANVETAYTLRNVTNFLIGSTSEVMDIGMPYTEMWSNLNSSSPTYSSLVSAFYNFYKGYEYPYGALSVIDCRKMDRIAIIMKKINDSYSLADSLRDSIQVLDGFQAPIYYDFSDYVHHLGVKASLLKTFDDAVQGDSLIRKTAYTDSLYTALRAGNPYIIVKSYCGIAISDPSLNSVALKGKEKTDWWKATH